MDVNNLLTFIAVAALLVISPGPNGFLITKTVSQSGQRLGFVNILGFVAAFYVHGTLSIFGISLILVQSAQAFFVFKILGAIYLIWIGLKAIYSAFKSDNFSQAEVLERKVKAASTRTAFLEGFFTNVLNPKVSMFYLAAFPQFISLEESAINAYVLVTTHSFVNFIWFALMVLMLTRFNKVTKSIRFKKWLSPVTGVAFIGFGSKLAFMENG